MLKRLMLLVTAVAATGCSSISGDYGLVAQSLWQSRNQAPLPTFTSGLNAQYRYLAVHPTNGVAAVFVLGVERSTPAGLVEVWYSADGVMLETLEGRISRTRGYPVQWASVNWRAEGNTLLRQRDDITDNAFGITDRMVPAAIGFADVPLKAWSPWQKHAAALSQLDWLSDDSASTPSTFATPPGWTARGEHRGLKSWVLSYQCMTADFCMHLARWPLELGSPS